jgi:hypothetical protein
MGDVIDMGRTLGVGLSPADWARLHLEARKLGISAECLAAQLIELKLEARKTLSVALG